jgi:hypothetical protein
MLIHTNSVTMVAFVLLSAYSLYPTKEARLAHEAKVAERKAEKEKFASSPYDNEMTAEEQWQHMWELQQLPRTPGTAGGLKSPMTPRTRAFGALQGGVPQTPVTPAGYYGEQIYRTPDTPSADYDYGYEGKGKGTAY